MSDSEPNITINGIPLTKGQAMTLRVAMTHWLCDLDNDPEYRREMGPIGDAYRARLVEIQDLMG